MEKKSLLTANWLKAAFLLMVMCFSGLYAQANTTNTVDLGEGNDGYLVPGKTYTIPANTIATGRYYSNYDGTITLTSSVSANTNLVPFTDNTYSDIVESVRDEEANTKTFVFSAGNRGNTVYFKSVVSTTPYEVKFDYVRASNLEDYVESIVPEDGSVVSSLKDFTINFTTKIYGVRNSAKLYKGETLVAEKTLEYKANVNTYSFSFDEEITESGDYTLVFPEETFTCGSGMKGSSEWKFYYTIDAPQPKMNVSLIGGATEAEAVTFNNLNGVATFENTTATIKDEYANIGLYGALPGAPAGMGTWYVHYAVTKVSDTEYTLTPNADELASLNTDRAYQFKIPEGYFTYADGSKSPAYETWVKYEAPQVSDVTIAFSPIGGTEDAPAQVALEDLSNITLTLTGAESIALSTAALVEDSAIRLRAWNQYWEDYSDAIVYKPELVEGTTYKLVPFDEYYATNIPILSSGKYELNIPAGTFVFNGEETNINLTTTTYYNLVLPTYTILPEPNSTIEATETEGLMQVQIRFNNESSVTPSQTVTASLKKDGVVVEEGIFAQKNWAQQNMAYIWFSKTYTESGEYEVVLPEGYVTLGSGAAAEAMTIKYTVVGSVSTEPALVVTPEGGTEDAPVAIDVFEFVVKAENATRIDYANGGGWMALNGWVTSRSGQEGWNNSMWPTITRVDDATLKFTFENYSIEEILEGTTNGKYQFYIPAGDLWFNGDEAQKCEEVALYYTYNGGVSVPEVILTPAVGSTVSSIEAETITFEVKNASEVTVNPLMLDFNNDPLCLLIDPNNNWISVYPVAVEGETNKFKFVPFDGQPQYPFTTEGTYGIWIPTGTFFIDGVEYEGLYEEKYITVGSSVEPVMVVTPEDGSEIESYEDIRISFEGVTTVEINPSALDAEFGKVMLIPDDNWFSSAVAKPVAVEGETNVFALEVIDGQLPATFSTLLFCMEEGTFWMDGADSPAIEYTYKGKEVVGEPKMVVTPQAGTTVKALTSDVITISFENVTEVKINDYALIENYCKISIIKPDGSYYRTMPIAIEGETNKFRLVNFDGSDFNLTAEGTYGIWINGFPSPAFYMDGVAAPEFYEKAFVTVASYTYVAEPAEGYVSSLENVALTFNPEVESINTDATSEVVLYKDNEEVERISAKELQLVGWGASGSSLSIQFSKEYVENGEYKVVIPANVVVLEGGVVNNEITLNYAIGGGSSDWTVVADPAPGVVNELTTIFVTFEGASQIAVSPEAGPNDFPYYGTVAEDGTVTKVPYSIFTFAEGLNVISLSIQNEEQKLSEPGKYAVIIPAAYCTVDGVAMTEDIRLDYTIEGAQPEYTVVINPADGATVNGEQLYEITVTFDGAKTIELNGDQATTFYQLDENGSPIANIYQNMSAEGNVAKFTVMELHKPYLDAAGTFQFTIPVGMVTVTDNNGVVGKNKENIVATYYSNGVGVDVIGVDAKDLNIYTVSGMLIKRNGTYDDVKALEPGIYIINGKKFYVK